MHQHKFYSFTLPFNPIVLIHRFHPLLYFLYLPQIQTSIVSLVSNAFRTLVRHLFLIEKFR